MMQDDYSIHLPSHSLVCITILPKLFHYSSKGPIRRDPFPCRSKWVVRACTTLTGITGCIMRGWQPHRSSSSSSGRRVGGTGNMLHLLHTVMINCKRALLQTARHSAGGFGSRCQPRKGDYPESKVGSRLYVWWTNSPREGPIIRSPGAQSDKNHWVIWPVIFFGREYSSRRGA